MGSVNRETSLGKVVNPEEEAQEIRGSGTVRSGGGTASASTPMVKRSGRAYNPRSRRWVKSWRMIAGFMGVFLAAFFASYGYWGDIFDFIKRWIIGER